MESKASAANGGVIPASTISCHSFRKFPLGKQTKYRWGRLPVIDSTTEVVRSHTVMWSGWP